MRLLHGRLVVLWGVCSRDRGSGVLVLPIERMICGREREREYDKEDRGCDKVCDGKVKRRGVVRKGERRAMRA